MPEMNFLASCKYKILIVHSGSFFTEQARWIVFSDFFFCNFGKGPEGLSDWEKQRGKPLNWEICYNSAQSCHFLSIKNKLAITHTIDIKLKENITT